MADVNGLSNINSVLEQYSYKKPEIESETPEKDMFLKLMMAQMENQDPLNPQDNGEFLSQLAQFSTVEGIEKLNTSMDSFASGFRSSQALQATALVGRKVQVKGNEAYMNGNEPLTGTINIPKSTADLKLHVFNSAGSLVRTIEYGTAPGGEAGFEWDGKDADGNMLPPDMYRVEATASQDGEIEQMETFVYANVDSVTIGTGGDVTLNVENVGAVALEDVRQIQ